ncbi:hypothetical protein LTR04_003322, partial [Oleoguttula sp. CCFEE 6159]
ELTDAGMEKIAAGLLHPEVRQWRRLEVVNLSGNALTTNALAIVAPVIADARFELRDLDLSKNHIKVTTDEEAQDWELFLRSFEDCRTLRCLDLSDNPLGGSRAIEIMARVYLRDLDITKMPPAGSKAVISVAGSSRSLSLDKEIATGPAQAPLSETQRRLSELSMTGGTELDRLCGLRSLPLLNLNNVSMTDTDALHLSFILDRHQYPQQLIDKRNADNATSEREEYKQNTAFRGIAYGPEQELSSDGFRVLKEAEVVREAMFTGDGMESSYDTIDDFKPYQMKFDLPLIDEQHAPCSTSRRASAVVEGNLASADVRNRGSFSTAGPKKRRASGLSAHSGISGAFEGSDSPLDSARRKIQRAAIAESKLGSVELWSTALLALGCARTILLSNRPRQDSVQESLPEAVDDTALGALNLANAPDAPVSPPSTVNGTWHNHRPSYAASLTASAPSVFNDAIPTITEMTNRCHIFPRATSPSRAAPSKPSLAPSALPLLTSPPSATNPRLKHLSSSRPSFGRETSLRELYTLRQHSLLLAAKALDNTLNNSNSNNSNSSTGTGNGYRDPTRFGALPRRAIDERDVLSAAQRKAVLEWAGDRKTLLADQNWRGRDGSARTWCVLHRVGCLDYDA